ncbi:MAG: LacI family transcriptional regulator [Chloroflexi bacterium]|nr:LacI family transcriptional regulator [Chloroflexota bacterium]
MHREAKRSLTPTIYDVAREAGVSYSTVSRTLSGYEFVKPSTREKVLRAAEKLGYVPNHQARSLAGGRSHLIGVLVPGLNNSYIGEILRGIDEALAESEYNLLLYTTHRRQGKESHYAATIMNSGVDGLLLVVPLMATPYLDTLHERDFPCVVIDQSEETQKGAVVSGTNWQGAFEATEYLIGLGHCRIGFISGLAGLTSTTERLAGYSAALAQHGLALDERLIAEGSFLQEGGYTAAQQLLALPDRPTAIFAANDLSALGAMEAVREHGLRIPKDISLVGFDDIPQASLGYPKLTTVRQPLSEMGREAANILLEEIAHPEQPRRRVTLPTKLIIRDSCCPPAG